jgi:hypothetical protein
MNKITLPKGYHNFADKRTMNGLPNAMNVLSNLFIIIPVIYLLKHKTENNTNNNLLIIHITLLSLASAYYHYNPSVKSIFWDILMISTLSIIVLNIINEYKCGILFYILGILSVVYWKQTGDIRLYLLILIGVPIIFFLKYYDNEEDDETKKNLYIILFFTVLYRFVEYYDHQIYKLTNNMVSGHTLKHIFAGLSILYIVKLLKEYNKI